MALSRRWWFNGGAILLVALLLPNVHFSGWYFPILGLLTATLILSNVTPQLVDTSDHDFLPVEFFLLNLLISLPMFFALTNLPQIHSEGYSAPIALALAATVVNTIVEMRKPK